MRLILVMIVKDEEAIISRCMRNLKGLIDGAVICDTGSTDQTREIVQRELEEVVGPDNFQLTEEPWKNFGYNRTVVLRQAREFTAAKKWPLDETYMLTIDADMQIDWSRFSKTELDICIPGESEHYDSFYLEQRTGDLIYSNRRLLRCDREWISEGVTHELNTAKDSRIFNVTINSLRIVDHNDGSSHAVKGQRDIMLLRQGIKDEPTNVRYMFYMANTLRETNIVQNLREAIEWYELHRKLQQWAEEKWYSLLAIGRTWEALHEHYKNATGLKKQKYNRARVHPAITAWNKATGAYLQAYQERPQRAEPLYYLARYCRLTDKPQLAYMYAREAVEIQRPTDDILFVNSEVYEYLAHKELSISAFYGKKPMDRSQGFQSLQYLLRLHDSMKPIPWNICHEARLNLSAYRSEALAVSKSFIFNRLQLPAQLILPQELQSTYRLCNPSAVLLPRTGRNDRLGIVVRAVNYRQERVRVFTSRDADGAMRTKNYYIECEVNSITQEITCCVDTLRPLWTNDFSGPYSHKTNVHGIEDARIFRARSPEGIDELWVSACSLEMTEDNLPKIVYFPLNPGPSSTVRLVEGQTLGTCEKNWLPLDADICQLSLERQKCADPATYASKTEAPMMWLYGMAQSPGHVGSTPSFAVFVTDGEGICEMASKAGRTCLDLRGSSGPVDLTTVPHLKAREDNGRFLVLYHVVSDRPDVRYYYHCFVLFTEKFAVCAQSDVFLFETLGVEMATGLVLTPTGQLLVTLGTDDSNAQLIRLGLEGVLSTLR